MLDKLISILSDCSVDKGFCILNEADKNSDFYFHRSYEDLGGFNYKVLFQPVKVNIVSKLFKKPDIPFPWIRIKNGTNGEKEESKY